MKVEQVFSDKKRFLDLLLLADEQEDMVDRYLERGEMFTLYDGGELRAACVVTNEGEGIYYSDRCSVMFVGTGDTPHSLSFYQSCGFVPSHRVENFFTDHYDHPICEDGILLRDMVYLKREKL